MKFLHSKKGFTIVETLVAVAILSIGIAAPMTAVYTGVDTARRAQDQLFAYYLAQEGAEYIRYVRDTNVLRGDPWLTHLGRCTDGDGCIIDDVLEVAPIGLGANIGVDCAGSCPVVEYDPADNLFGEFSGGGIEDTAFTRRVDVNALPGGNEAEIRVTVTWTVKGNLRTYVLQERIFNWSGT